MWSKMNYRFVLAVFFFEAVASVPYPPPNIYLENDNTKQIEENERRFHQNVNSPAHLISAHERINTYESTSAQQNSQDSNFLHSLPASMSPIPTKRHVNNEEEDIYPRHKIITHNFRTPREVIIDTPPVVYERHRANNKVGHPSATNTEHERVFDGATQQLHERPVNNQMSDQNRIPNIGREPLRVEENPYLQTVRKPFFTTSFQGIHLPVDVTGHITPVNAEDNKQIQVQTSNHGEHVYIPNANAPIAVPGKHYENVQNILSSERIRGVLSSTKHTKRYLVIHPNGTVEHIDSMERIAKSHPNYILVNAAHIAPSTPKLQMSPDAGAPGAKSSSETILTEQPVTQISSIHSISKTETVPVPREVIALVEVTSPAENIKLSKVNSSVEMASKGENTAILTESSNSSSANAAVTNTEETVGDTFSEQKTESETNTVHTNTETDTVSETNSSSTHNTIVEQNEQEIQGKTLLKDAEIIDVDSLGQPIAWFNTSDPDFWTKLTEGRENNIIYFFNVNSRPRIEKDTIRTIQPDGTILEEVTESIWYNENDPVPIVTTTSRIIHPDDLSRSK